MVKEDLIDDIAKESGPYHPPEKIMRRSDMATDFSTPQQRTIKPNELVIVFQDTCLCSENSTSTLWPCDCHVISL